MAKRIHLHQYRGKSLLLTFIYTRCPLPDYCPLMSKNFAQILGEVRSDPELSPSTHLLSISIDPEYDKPAVLRTYGLNVARATPIPSINGNLLPALLSRSAKLPSSLA